MESAARRPGGPGNCGTGTFPKAFAAVPLVQHCPVDRDGLAERNRLGQRRPCGAFQQVLAPRLGYQRAQLELGPGKLAGFVGVRRGVSGRQRHGPDGEEHGASYVP